ncbi:hypothetical protein GGD50_000151 [Rhizobium paranaense]|uniref:Uncharacterized protein n=1 Tax=Rhizobium paranaense TaxID=1650438 RepID=A0A7W8XLP6_9HYPH|nr:hypothetical protein [Rhizobium paranaense]
MYAAFFMAAAHLSDHALWRRCNISKLIASGARQTPRFIQFRVSFPT